MKVKRFEGNGRMSKVVHFGDTLYLCGQTSPADEGVTAQTKEVLSKIETLLDTYGSDKQHILSAAIFLKNIGDFAAMNAVWDAWVEPGHEPARTCIEANMASEKILVEITVTAAVKSFEL